MSGGNIKYTPIKDIIKDDAKDGDYNFYGLIYDASLPLLEDNSDNFMCSIKLIDREVNWISHKNSLNRDILSLIIKSTSKENLPFVHCVGDIIRVHRANYRNKKNSKKIIYINISNFSKFRTNWVIFAGASDVNSTDECPIACSSTNYIFEDFDKKFLSEYRAWLRKYIREKDSLIYSRETKLVNRNQDTNDYDVLVTVLDKKEMGDRILYFVQDETDSCELHALIYFNFLEPNDIIRVRNLRAIDGNRRHLVMNKFSNILKIPRSTSHSLELLKRIERKINDHKNNEENALNEVKRDDIVYTYIEFPQRIIIEPDLTKINTEKYSENLQKQESNSLLNENELICNEENTQNIMIIDEDNLNKGKIPDENIFNEIEEEIDIEKAIKDFAELKPDSKPLEELLKSKSICDLNETDKYAVLTLNVLDYYPKNLLDFCMIFCPQCEESYYSKEIITDAENANAFYFKESEVHEEKYFCKFKCNANQTSCIPYYNFMLVCRENSFSNTLVKLHFSSFDYEGSDFLNLPIRNFSTNQDAFEKLKDVLDKIIKPDNYIKVLVEVTHQGNEFILRVVGNYKHK